MNIAVYMPIATSDHDRRGVGTYGKCLMQALKEINTDHKFTFLNTSQPTPSNTDVIHYTFFDPFFLTLPLIKSKKTVVTVHDLIPIRFPEYFPRGVRGAMKWNIQKISLRGSRRIITDSFSSKSDIEKFTGFPSTRIDPIYLAPTLNQEQGREKNVGFFRKMGLNDPYILYVGDVNWNKNVIGLLKAFQILIRKNIHLKLILVGSSFHKKVIKEVNEIMSQIQLLSIEKYIMMPGFVNASDLQQLYAQAAFTVVPSYYEGFGFSVLDAFALGCPVVAADNSSLSEISGPALRCDASNITSIAQMMEKAVRMSKLERDMLIQKGYDWVSLFSWRKTARKTIRSYEKAFDNNAGL